MKNKKRELSVDDLNTVFAGSDKRTHMTHNNNHDYVEPFTQLHYDLSLSMSGLKDYFEHEVWLGLGPSLCAPVLVNDP